MNLSIIANTCALGPRAEVVTGSTTPTPHALRAYAFRHFILPSYVASGAEVIVAGEWCEGEGYTYVPSPSLYFSAVDALTQRQAGFEAASGDVVAFVHDDHFLDVAAAFRPDWEWIHDVYVPVRKRRDASSRLLTLNNGLRYGYISGHAAIYRRDVIERAPWGDVPKVHTWDIEHTKRIVRHGAEILQTPAIVAYDVEVET